MANRPLRLTPGRQQLLVLLIAAVIFYIVLPQVGSFRHSVTLAKDARPGLLGISLLFTGLSYVAAAVTYCLLSIRRLSYPRTLLIQLAGMFVNRLLPAGIGSISVNFLNLRQSGHTSAQAASVVAVNNSLGILGNMLLLIGLWIPYHEELPELTLGHINRNILLIAAISVAVAVLWLVFYSRYRGQLLRDIRVFGRQIIRYGHRPGRLSTALFSSVSLTLANVLSLWFCVLAMHISLPFVAVLIAYSFGVALGSATPTPGGLGGVEAGLVAGLMTFGVEGDAALAAVLVYRLISYWLPLLAGGLSFIASQRLGYISLQTKKRGAV